MCRSVQLRNYGDFRPKCSLNNQSFTFGGAFSLCHRWFEGEYPTSSPRWRGLTERSQLRCPRTTAIPTHIHDRSRQRSLLSIGDADHELRACSRREKLGGVFRSANALAVSSPTGIASRDIASETHLQFAVMEETVRCLLRYRLSSSAASGAKCPKRWQWVNLQGDHDRFSFDSICQVFEIDSGMLRQRLNSISRSFRSRSPFFRR